MSFDHEGKRQSLQERERSPFSLERVKSELDAPVLLEETPAVDILAYQLKTIERTMDKRNPPLTKFDRAYAIASQFRNVTLPTRVTEGSSRELPTRERVEAEEMLVKTEPAISAEMSEVITRLRAKGFVLKENFRREWCLLKQGDSSQARYEVYLGPRLVEVPKLFSEFALQVSPRAEYDMRTFAPKQVPARKLGRRDKIAINVTEESFPLILAELERLYRHHPEAFQGQLAPGNGIYVPADGISVARKSEREDQRGERFIARQIEESLRQGSRRELERIVQSFSGNVQEFSRTIQALFMWKALKSVRREEDLEQGVSWYEEVFSQGRLTLEEGKVLTQQLLEAKFDEWFRALRQQTEFQSGRVKSGLLKRLDRMQQRSWRKEIAAAPEGEFAPLRLEGGQDLAPLNVLAAFACITYLFKERNFSSSDALRALIAKD